MNRISRRGLLRSGAAAGVLSLTGLPVRAQHRGGTLVAGLSGAHSSDSWDSRTHADIFMIAAGHGCVFDCLTEVAADGTLQGELAESWEVSADAKVWTFNLRRGVTFHNGASFGADDVIASLQLHLEEGSNSPVRTVIAAITEMRRLTDHQVQFTLREGNADFPYLMSDYHLVMYPAGAISEAMYQGIGTGLYQVESFEPGARLTATRVKDHYKGDTAGFFGRIEFVAVTSDADRPTALQSGQVDVIDRVSPHAVAGISANKSLRLQEVVGNQHYSLSLRHGTAFDDLNLRKALKHGINRTEMVEQVLLGHGEVGNDTPIGPMNQYFNASLAQLEFDPDKARHFLAKAGLDSLSLTLSTSDTAFSGAGEAADLFRSSAAMAGIDINIVEEATDGYWADAWLQSSFATGHWSGRATEDWMLSTAYADRAAWGDGGLQSHARFQDLLVKARAELDSEKRQDDYYEMQEILRDEGSTLIPMFANFLQATHKGIETPETIGSLWPMDNARMAERWSRA